MFVAIIIFILILSAGISSIFVGRKKDLGFNKLWLNLFFLLLLIAAFWLIMKEESQIREAFLRRSWPTINAEILDTQVTGERAFNPEITYRFQIDSISFVNKSNLHAPGFGRKRSRRQTSEIIISDYQVGSHLKVHYNPLNPQESYIRTGPYWSDYMQLSVGILILYIALAWLSAGLVNRFRYRM